MPEKIKVPQKKLLGNFQNVCISDKTPEETSAEIPEATTENFKELLLGECWNKLLKELQEIHEENREKSQKELPEETFKSRWDFL